MASALHMLDHFICWGLRTDIGITLAIATSLLCHWACLLMRYWVIYWSKRNCLPVWRPWWVAYGRAAEDSWGCRGWEDQWGWWQPAMPPIEMPDAVYAARPGRRLSLFEQGRPEAPWFPLWSRPTSTQTGKEHNGAINSSQLAISGVSRWLSWYRNAPK